MKFYSNKKKRGQKKIVIDWEEGLQKFLSEISIILFFQHFFFSSYLFNEKIKTFNVFFIERRFLLIYNTQWNATIIHCTYRRTFLIPIERAYIYFLTDGSSSSSLRWMNSLIIMARFYDKKLLAYNKMCDLNKHNSFIMWNLKVFLMHIVWEFRFESLNFQFTRDF